MKIRFVVCVLLIALLSGCAVSGIMRQSVEKSSEEFYKWVELFKARLDKMPDEDIGPFTVWVVTIIGDDKTRLPREGERLVDRIAAMTTTKPDGYKFSKKERAELLGSWDRLFVILYEEAGTKGLTILKKLIPAIGGWV